MVRVLRPTFRISPPGDSPDRAPKSGAPAGHHPRGGQLLRDPPCRRPEARLPVLDRRLRAGTFPRERAGSLRPAWIQIPLPQTFPRERPTRPSGRPRPRAPPPSRRRRPRSAATWSRAAAGPPPVRPPGPPAASRGRSAPRGRPCRTAPRQVRRATAPKRGNFDLPAGDVQPATRRDGQKGIPRSVAKRRQLVSKKLSSENEKIAKKSCAASSASAFPREHLQVAMPANQHRPA